MRFFRVKHEQTCRGCGSTMLPDDEAIVLRICGIPYTFHVGCFLEWNRTTFTHRLEQWRATQTGNHKVKPKRGRPRKYTNPIEASRLRVLKHYYIKKGNLEKIGELEHKLGELRA